MCECELPGHESYVEFRRVFRGWPSRRLASILLGPLNVTRLRHLQQRTARPAGPCSRAVVHRFLLHITSRLLHPHLISPHLITASRRHVDKCSQRDAHHAFPDFVFQTSLLTIDPSTAEVSAAHRIIGNHSHPSTPPPSSRGAASKLGLQFESRSRGNFAFASNSGRKLHMCPQTNRQDLRSEIPA